jgi:hypothetical protein
VSSSIRASNSSEEDTTADTDGCEDEKSLSRAHALEHGGKVVELARKHGFGEFEFERTDNIIHEDKKIPASVLDAGYTAIWTGYFLSYLLAVSLNFLIKRLWTHDYSCELNRMLKHPIEYDLFVHTPCLFGGMP